MKIRQRNKRKKDNKIFKISSSVHLKHGIFCVSMQLQYVYTVAPSVAAGHVVCAVARFASF